MNPCSTLYLVRNQHNLCAFEILLPEGSNEFNEDDPVEQTCKTFMEQTCGCTMGTKGSPCSSLFPLKYYVARKQQVAELTSKELDLLIMGSLMSVVNTQDDIKDGRHKLSKRKRTFCCFQIDGQRVCQVTYRFLLGIGNHRLKSIKSHLKHNGLTPRVNGNTRKLPHNTTPFEEIQRVVKFILNYAEDHAILLPGRIPGYKRDDIKLLPSNVSKQVSLVIHYYTVPSNVSIP